MKEWTIVTGGAGFIGSNVVAHLNQRGIRDILLVDDLGTDERWRNLLGLQVDEIWPVARFREAIRIADLPHPVRTIYHLGACSATTETDASYLLDNNYECTKEICRFCLNAGVRLVYASSAATYGDGEQSYSDAPGVSETLRPLNMYGLSKWLFDEWAIQTDAIKQIVGLKYFNVYGPGEAHKGDMRSVIHKAYGQIRETGMIKLFKSYRPDYANGEQVRDFIYVKDAVEATLFFGEDARAESGLFNCGTGQARSWNDLARAVFSAMNMEPHIEYIDMPTSLRQKYQYYTQADVSRLREAGYTRDFYSLEDGIADYIQTLENE